jgi:hypothetical protein
VTLGELTGAQRMRLASTIKRKGWINA